MDPSMTNASPASEVPVLIARDAQRQTIPIDWEDGQQQRQQQDDAPPPYEVSATGPTSASDNPATTTASFTPPFSSRSSLHELGECMEQPRSSCSSFGEEDTAGLLAGSRGGKCGAEEGYMLTSQHGMRQQQHQEGDEGYARTDPMSFEAGDKWEGLRDTPGCCFSESAGCCFSKRGGCCFSDRGGCCCSDTSGCCFSSDGACCFSGAGGRPQL